MIDSLSHLEDLGLVVSTTHQRGKVKTYYVSDPPPDLRRQNWSPARRSDPDLDHWRQGNSRP